MATYYSPKIVTDGLVLCLDAGNIKSFKGEATVNYYSTPETLTNGRIGATSGGTYTDYVTGGPNGGKFTRWTNDTGSTGATAWHWQIDYSNTGLTAGQQLNISFYARRSNGTLANITLNSPDSVAINATLTTEWQRFNAVITYGGDYTSTPFVRINRSNSNTFALGTTYDIALVQIETKAYATTFTTGTRGTTVATGGGWADLSELGNHGELVNGVKENSSNGGNVLFDGVNDYCSISNVASLRPSTEMTISMWVKAITNTAAWNILFGQSPYTGGPLIFLETGGSLIRALHYPNGSEVRCNTNYAISTSTFTNVVFTFKTGDAIKSYFNGVANTTVALSSGTFSYNTSNPYLIGYIGGNWFNGQISQTAVYNRALSSSEVLQNYNATKGRFGL